VSDWSHITTEELYTPDHVEEVCPFEAKSVILERDNTVKVLSYNERRVRHVWQMNMKCSMEIIPAADQAMLHPKRP
jgi:hypothetical protein